MRIHDGKEKIDNDSFLIFKMNIEGANWQNNEVGLVLSKELTHKLAPLRFTWVKLQDKETQETVSEQQLMVPVYLNKSRRNLLFSVKMNRGGIERYVLYQRGLALIASDS